MYKGLIFYLLIALFFTGNHIATAQVYGTENGYASFEAEMPLNSYTGETDRLNGSIDFETGQVAFRVPVKTIKTGKEKRDEHMYELLEAEKNPHVIFEGKLIGDFDLDKRTEQTVKVKGDFTLGGTSRTVTIGIHLKPVEKGLQMKASWSLFITDYNLERPSLLFVKIDDKHDLKVDALLVKK